MKKFKMKKLVALIVVALAAGVGLFITRSCDEAEKAKHAHLVSGNGRLEATEISISAKLAGRIENIMVNEGDFVTQGQKLAVMQTNVLQAELEQAKAKRNQTITTEASARAAIEVRLAEMEAAKALVAERMSSLDGAEKRYERLKTLADADAASQQEFENAETLYLSAKAELASAQATIKQSEAAIEVAKADAAGAAAAIKAAEADIDRIQADIDDSLLTAPREGRIQYRIAQPGEVLSGGGRVLNLVDLTDVYMTFFLPEAVAGKVQIGAEVRLLFDALPNVAIPAEVSYVASVAQFTPKTVETQSERQKLMFRVKARINPDLLKKYITLVKTGIPGVAWVNIDPSKDWPEFLELKSAVK